MTQKSRPQRWEAACVKAQAALEELRGVQEEYEEWNDNLPENLMDSAVAEKLAEVADLEVEYALDIVEQCYSTDLPRGFGRD